MMHKLIPLFFLLGITISSSAQNNGMASPQPDESGFAKNVLGDTTITFNELSIQKDTVSAFRLKKEYNWIIGIDSFLLAQNKEEDTQSKIVIKRSGENSYLSNLLNSAILQVFMWLIAISIVLFFVYKFLLSEAVFERQKNKRSINVLTEQENISIKDDFDNLLRKAYQNGDWRHAMRFLFLKTLQKLNEKELIKYAVDKTNSVYVLELPLAKRKDFTSLAHYYDYVWYGNVKVQKHIFDLIEKKFNAFLNKI